MMPFKQPTTTPTPDELFDYWLGGPEMLGPAELRTLLYLVRRTLGFAKSVDAVSIQQFMKGITKKDGTVLDYGCGVRNRRNLTRALASLEERRLVRRLKGKEADGGDATTLYTLWFEGDLPAALARDHDDPRRGTVKAPRSRAPAAPSGIPQQHPQETGSQQTAHKSRARPYPARRTQRAPTAAEARAANARWGFCVQCGCKPCAC